MRRDGKGQAKHRANLNAIVHEAFEIADPHDGHPIPIRKSASETYDKSRTVNNKYVGYQTADDVIAALGREADAQSVEVRTKDKNTGETVIRNRSLPSTAVRGVAVIFKPPCAVARNWTRDQYDKFIRDCEDSLAQIPCVKLNKKGEPTGKPYYLFRRENIIARAEHWDEGEPVEPPVFTCHWHDMYKPEDQCGKYNGNMIDTFFLSEMVNRMFPQLMRERGWDIDDPEHTDWAKFHTDQEYRTARKSRICRGGRSVNQYRADKKLEEADAKLNEAQDMINQAAAIRQATEADAELRQAQAEAAASEIQKAAEAEADQMRADTRAELYQQREFAEMGLSVITDARNSAQQELDGLTLEVKAARKIINAAKTAEAEKNRLDSEVEAVRAEKIRLEKEIALLRENVKILKEQLEDMVKEAEQTAKKIISDAKAKAQEIFDAATGEYSFLRRWMTTQKYQSGRTYMEIAKAAQEKEIRRNRMAQIKPEYQELAKGQMTGQDGPAKS